MQASHSTPIVQMEQIGKAYKGTPVLSDLPFPRSRAS